MHLQTRTYLRSACWYHDANKLPWRHPILMSHFLVLFDQKEGTSHLMVLLDHFAGVSVVHQTDNQGWEPFDRHAHHSLSTAALMKCLDLVFKPGHGMPEELNRIYCRTSQRPLEDFDKNDDIGFKMRFEPDPEPGRLTRLTSRIPGFGPQLARRLDIERRWYQYRLLSLLRRHKVVVLFAVRQDLYRWALSKYHGDGTGKDGHLQFDIAQGDIEHSEVPAIKVDPVRFQRIIDECRSIVEFKIWLRQKMRRARIRTHAVIYEEYLSDPVNYFQNLFRAIDHPVSDAEIAAVLEQGSGFRKVHSEDVSDFVLNHTEIEAKFADCVIDFESARSRHHNQQ
jgi:hypothetical protein